MAFIISTKFLVMAVYVAALFIIITELAAAFPDVVPEKYGRKILQDSYNTTGRSGYNGYTTTGRGGYN